MGKIVALDDGHGMDTAGKRTPMLADGTVMHENEFNRAVMAYAWHEAVRCGLTPVLTAPSDKDHSLKERVKIANDANADVLVSCHANAFDASFEGKNPEGFEVIHYPNSVEGKKLASKIHDEIANGTKQVDRGVKSANLYILHYSKMPACLIEFGFMDNPTEANLLRSDSFRKECAVELIKGVCTYLGVPYVSEIVPQIPNNTLTLPKPTTHSGDEWVRRLQSTIGTTSDGIAGTKTLAKCPTLSRGSQGTVVALLQEKFNSLGIGVGKEDGLGGKMFRAGIIEFQRRNGLLQDGVFGQKCWKKLFGL